MPECSPLNLKLLLLIFILHTNNIFAWQIWLDSTEHQFESGVVLLEPDNWNRKQLEKLKARKVKPIAWLNVSQIEPKRLIVPEIKKKLLIIKRRFHPEGGELARFYGLPFKNLLKQRISEYIEKGFSGILLARPFLYRYISNSPINKLEMQKLLTELFFFIKSLDPRLLVLVHNSYDLYKISSNSPIDGVVIEGLFNSSGGYHKHPWQRKKAIYNLKKWIKYKKYVLCVDEAKQTARKEFIKRECKKYKFDTAFSELPLKLKRRIKEWWKEKN